MGSSHTRRWTGIAAAVAVAVCMTGAVPAGAAAATFLVAEDGADTGDCTVDACATVQYAIDQHRLAPAPDDVIQIGPGEFVGNVEAEDPLDDGLTISGTLTGREPATTLHGEDDGAVVGGSPTGIAVLLGGCGSTGTELRDVSVDTVGADPSVQALELDGGSDVTNVRAANQPGNTAFAVLSACGPGSVVQRSEITADDDELPVVAFDGIRFVRSTATSQSELSPALAQIPGGLPNTHLLIKRSTLSLPETSTVETVFAGSRLTLDSSLVTGGGAGVYATDDALINNSTIDAGEAGVSDPLTPSLFLDSFTDFADVSVESAILVDGIEAPSGDGEAVCTHSDLPPAEQGGDYVVDCPTGPGTTNTTTDPSDLFVGGTPYDWTLAPGSSGIDTGAPGDPAPGLAVRDLVNKPRRAAGTGATCPDGIRDKGAYEFVGPPCELSAPTLLDAADPHPLDRLTATRGGWSNLPTRFALTWLSCDAAGDNCTEVGPPPRTGIGYTIRDRDLGHTIRVQVVARNAAGDSAPALSAPSGVVTRPPS